MASLANLNGISPSLQVKCSKVDSNSRRPAVAALSSNETEHPQQPQLPTIHCSRIQPTRRVVLGLAGIALSLQFGIDKSLAEDNGYWVTGLLTQPPVMSKIANEETGTRSFLHKGIYVSNVGPKGSAYRLKRNAFDLLDLEAMLTQDAWHYVRKYLHQKCSTMYYDFDTVISAAPVSDKEPLTALANRLFNNVEKLDDAVKLHNLPQAETCYQETNTILREVMDRFA